ncbi:MAG TPA: helix-turn-helix transcriptional regulator [Opitutaceae bacterium]
MARYPTIVVRGEVLESWLTVSGYTRARLARELHISKGRISQLLNSHEEPSAHLMAKLSMLTRLPFDRLFRILKEAPAGHRVRRQRKAQPVELGSAEELVAAGARA